MIFSITETSQSICSETESHLKFTTMTLHKKKNFPLKISSVIATFSEEILNGKLPFSVQCDSLSNSCTHCGRYRLPSEINFMSNLNKKSTRKVWRNRYSENIRKIGNINSPIQRRIQNPAKHLRSSLLRK